MDIHTATELLRAVVPQPPAHPEANPQVSSHDARNRSPNAAVPSNPLATWRRSVSMPPASRSGCRT